MQKITHCNGRIGVPMPFLDKAGWQEKFYIVGESKAFMSDCVDSFHAEGTTHYCLLNGKELFTRIFIRRRLNESIKENTYA